MWVEGMDVAEYAQKPEEPAAASGAGQPVKTKNLGLKTSGVERGAQGPPADGNRGFAVTATALSNPA